jgi:hypothetical protein
MAKQGRPKIENYVPVERIKKAYQVHKTIAGASRALSMDPKTLRRVLKENGVEINKPSYVDLQKYGAMSRREGCLVKWLKENPGAKLPARMTEIAKVTGCSYDAVKSYIRRRRQAVKDLLSTLPDIREIEGSFEDTLGYFVSTDSIKDYKYRINKFSCDVYIVAELKDGAFTEIHIDNIKDFQKRLEDLLQ